MFLTQHGPTDDKETRNISLQDRRVNRNSTLAKLINQFEGVVLTCVIVESARAMDVRQWEDTFSGAVKYLPGPSSRAAIIYFFSTPYEGGVLPTCSL